MKKLLLSLHLITSALQLNGMSMDISHNFDIILPPEMQCQIINFVAQNSSLKKPKDATKIINILARVNKLFNTHINSTKISDQFIHFFAHKYRCSHQTIARYLQTKESQKRLRLQSKLKYLCCSDKDYNLLPRLNKLIQKGVNLEFTYNHENLQKTPLMISMHYNNNMFQYLLDHGANINGCNTHGITALHSTLNAPINMPYLTKLTTNPAVAINQRNRQGETALLYCLTHRKKYHISRAFLNAIPILLKAGVDPEMTNNRWISPLTAAKKLKKPLLARMINNAINEKNRLLTSH